MAHADTAKLMLEQIARSAEGEVRGAYQHPAQPAHPGAAQQARCMMRCAAFKELSSSAAEQMQKVMPRIKHASSLMQGMEEHGYADGSRTSNAGLVRKQ